MKMALLRALPMLASLPRRTFLQGTSFAAVAFASSSAFADDSLPTLPATGGDVVFCGEDVMKQKCVLWPS